METSLTLWAKKMWPAITATLEVVNEYKMR